MHIALLFFGCNEMMMGLALMKETVSNSSSLYTPFWQAALFIICGSLSIHTHSYPSKKLVTVCFSMYIVTILGGLFALVHRIVCFSLFSRHIWYDFYYHHVEPAYPRYAQLLSAEAVLFATTVCVIVLLISLSWFAKASLRSSHTQVIVRQHLTVIDSDRE
ncbi:DNA-directed RNA polymerases I and III subunit RPAC2 isoform X2 [Clupea harengus]|uniref:DNA-directed RNA polymerases I and III subunit RPAC2 isoform X2 n=1 Tax=Clupea harengus TaxID=7950 RepID=A0A6P8GVY4_CLUHA|nr:DNA-directed RNA polymerases I and III subunit RPAC2 isoform X2 [Clupea harengus]